MHDETGNRNKPRQADWISSVILVAVWLAGLFFVTAARPGIPKSMLAIGTVFFVLLIPAMKELVRTIERLVGRETTSESQSAEPAQQNDGNS